MQFTISLTRRVVATAVLAPIIGCLVLHQQGGRALGQTSGGARNIPDRSDRSGREINRRGSDLRERELALRMMEHEANRPLTRRGPQLAVMQIKSDFVRLQSVNNSLAEAALANTLTLKFIAKSASEIKKHADRLRHNLMLPEPEKSYQKPKAEPAIEYKQLMSSLLTLNHRIVGFVKNPLFEHADVIDAQASGEARRDLDWIIELSGSIKKSSEKLSKNAP